MSDVVTRLLQAVHVAGEGQGAGHGQGGALRGGGGAESLQVRMQAPVGRGGDFFIIFFIITIYSIFFYIDNTEYLHR